MASLRSFWSFFAVQHESLVFLGNQATVDAVGGSAGVGEHDGLLVGLVGQQPVEDLFFVHIVVER